MFVKRERKGRGRSGNLMSCWSSSLLLMNGEGGSGLNMVGEERGRKQGRKEGRKHGRVF
jgi:hypothetical protein